MKYLEKRRYENEYVENMDSKYINYYWKKIAKFKKVP